MSAPSMTSFLTLQVSTWTQQEWITLQFETAQISQSPKLKHLGLSLMFGEPEVLGCSLRNM